MPLGTVVETKPGPIWQHGARSPAKERVLCEELGISLLVAALLCQRGLDDPATAHKFLNPNLDDLGDPRLLPDYKQACEAILGARERNELIFVHGDYDVDGITSSAILDRFLNDIKCRVHTHVPHRIREGYGIHLQAVEQAHAMGAKLFLTCDCGISAHEQVDRARELGMAVVVTDHHEISDSMPGAQAVVNLHREDSLYPETELSGAGVVFRLCEGLTTELNYPVASFRNKYLDLACLGTIADVMPLLGENRLIAKFGLVRLMHTRKVGIQALMREAKVGQDPTRPIEAYNVGWHLGPRLNAAGRIEDAAQALKLLLERDEITATAIAQSLEAINTERRSRTAAIVEEAVEMVMEGGYESHNVIVVADPTWHPGIVGIVAGRLVEKFGRPTLVMTIDESTGMCKGSARSILGFHFAEAIWAFPDLLKGGGHAMAAGCNFEHRNLEKVRESLNAFASERISSEDFIPKLFVDFEVSGGELDDRTMQELALMEPFGCGNPTPLFLAKKVDVDSVNPTRNPVHVQLKLKHEEQRISGIAFHIGEQFAEVPPGSKLDLLFNASINEFRGRQNVQWQVKHFREAL